jgi:hypothetical protein
MRANPSLAVPGAAAGRITGFLSTIGAFIRPIVFDVSSHGSKFVVSVELRPTEAITVLTNRPARVEKP